MCLSVSFKKNFLFSVSLKSLKKGVGTGVGSGSVSQWYGSAPKCHGSRFPNTVVNNSIAKPPKGNQHKPNKTTARKPGPLYIIQYSLFLTYRYLEDGVETNEEELNVVDYKAWSSINHSILSVPGRWRAGQ